MTLRNIGKKRTPLGGTGYIIRKDILLEVGGFANHLVDDYELTFRLLRHNYQIVYAPLCINYDEKPPDLNIMLNQRARWLRGFLNLTKSRVAEPRDVIGNLFWVNPLTAFTGFALLLIAAYSTIHYLAFLYYPFHYSYIPLTIWLAITSAIFGLYTAALVMQYGKSGFKYAAWLPIYLPFSNYYMIVAIKAFFVKSWAETKTTH
jgi:cellulose synthase/poly-beta-1,6-N-acetylglucosamine synthase-like glycosyltransferase